MFSVDYKKQEIYTIAKSGYGWWLEYSTFKVINDIPSPVSILEVDNDDFPYYTLKKIEWSGNEKKGDH